MSPPALDLCNGTCMRSAVRLLAFSFLLALSGAPGHAQNESPLHGAQGESAAQPGIRDVLLGLWRGSYVCRQGETAVELSLTDMEGDDVRGTFKFFNRPGQTNVLPGEYNVKGSYNP